MTEKEKNLKKLEGIVGSYEELIDARKKLGLTGKDLEIDHIPSDISIKKAYQEKSEKKLTRTELRRLRASTTAIARTPESHREGFTHSGKNNKQLDYKGKKLKLSELDSKVLALASQRDLASYVATESKRGIDIEILKERVEKVHSRNIEIGIYTQQELNMVRTKVPIDYKKVKQPNKKVELELVKELERTQKKNFHPDLITPKKKIPKNSPILKNKYALFGLMGVGVSFIPQKTEASSLIKPNISNKIASKYDNLSNSEQYGAKIGLGMNALNTVQAGMEFKDGAKASLGELVKGDNYKKGLKEAVDGWKATSKPTAKLTALQASKRAGKSLLKKLPLLGLLTGIGFGAQRAWHGDWTGAGMEIASGAFSLVPGIGTAASVAMDVALLEKDTGIVSHGVDSISHLNDENNFSQKNDIEPKFIFPEEVEPEPKYIFPKEKNNIVSEKKNSFDKQQKIKESLYKKHKNITKIKQKNSDIDIMVHNLKSLEIETSFAKFNQLQKIVNNVSKQISSKKFKNMSYSSNISNNNVLSLSLTLRDTKQKIIFSANSRFEGDINEKNVYQWVNKQLNQMELLEKNINTQTDINGLKYKLNPNRLSQNIGDKKLLKLKSSSNIININLENKSRKLFKKLGIRHEKIPTLNHKRDLPQKIEGVYKKDNLSLRKNPRVSDKKAEAVAMHEIYHHTQKDKGLELGTEEATANIVEKAYLNENQETPQEFDFDLIYAYTIKQFYEHGELEQLVYVLGGDAFSARRVYSNAMEVISESKKKDISNEESYKSHHFRKMNITPIKKVTPHKSFLPNFMKDISKSINNVYRENHKLQLGNAGGIRG